MKKKTTASKFALKVLVKVYGQSTQF